jgi:hypothetical protein
MAASRAHIVRQLQFAAIRAFLKRRRAKRVMASAHVALRRRGFSLGDSHAAPSISIKIATILADLGGSWSFLQSRGGGSIVATVRPYSD